MVGYNQYSLSGSISDYLLMKSLNESSQKLHDVQQRIARACARVERDASEVLLIGAAKTVDATRLQPYISAGLQHVGENYVQEAQTKVLSLRRETATWHLIGALQRNKAKIAVELFDWIHSVDRLSLAQALDDAAREANKVQRVLLQVNLGGEASKAGCEPQQLLELATKCSELSHLDVQGLMCLPPFHDDAQQMRPYFRRLRELRDELQSARPQSTFRHLSMGMTNDFEVAIEEGATMVRVGTGLFGERTAR
jgi:pyridoxal phosphate enzyme (YggS family)